LLARLTESADDWDHFADAGNEREHIKERHAHQEQAERRGAPMMPASSSLTAKPGAHFVRDAAAGVLDLAPILPGNTHESRTRPLLSTSR
jgi:hypothetical protein